MARQIYLNVFILLLISCADFYLYGQARGSSRAQKPSKEGSPEVESLFIEAEGYYILGNYDKALFYFKKASQQDPSSGDIHYKIAETLVKRNEKDQVPALKSIEKALALEKRNKCFYLLASDVYAKLSNFSKAAHVLSTMFNEVDSTEAYLYQLGLLYRRAGKPNKAIKAYLEAEDFFGSSVKSLLPIHEIYLELGKEVEAIKVLNLLVSTFPDEEIYPLKLAELFAQKQQWKDAIDVLVRCVERGTKSQEVQFFLAELYYKNNQKRMAHSLLYQLFVDPAIGVASKINRMSHYVDVLRSKSPQPDTALVALTLGIFNTLKDTYPNTSEVNVIGGDLYLTLDSLQAAIAEYRKAFQRGATLFRVWKNILSLELELNQIDSLSLHSQKAISLFPDQALFYYFNGYSQVQMGHYKKASYILEEAKGKSGEQVTLKSTIYEMLGDVYYELKEYKRSDQAYHEALLLNPNNALVLNNYSYSLALRKNSLEEAEKMAIRAVEVNPTNNAYLDTYAWVLFIRGKYKKAKGVMKNVIKSDPSNPLFFDHYGDILFKLGAIEDAVHQWKKAKSKGLDNERINKKISNKKLP